MKHHDSYPLLWLGTESERHLSERAHQGWLRREAVRALRRRSRERGAKPRRALLRPRTV